MQIKTIVFDYGSVLVCPPSSNACSRVAEAAGIPEKLLKERYFHERAAYDRDTISNIEYRRRITRDYPAAGKPAAGFSLCVSSSFLRFCRISADLLPAPRLIPDRNYGIFGITFMRKKFSPDIRK